ncbi:MAG: PqqD family protein [Planctomycetes bacterium]|nr:PqqD family protein [Planctomycetota bacterium]
MQEQSPYKKNDDFVQRNIADTCVVLPIGKEVEAVRYIYNLNDTSSEVLRLFGEGKSKEEVVQELNEKYDIPEETHLDQEVDDCLDQLVQLKLLTK